MSPDGTRLSASFGEIDGKQNVRVFSTEKLLAGDVTPEAQFDFGPSVPSGFVFTRDGKSLVGSSYYTGVSNIFRYDLATERGVGAEQCRDRVLQAGSAARGLGPVRLPLLGRGVRRRRASRRKPLEDVSAITFFGERLVEAHPVLKGWMVGSPNDVNIEDKRLVNGALPPRRRPRSANRSTRSCRDTRTPQAVGVRANFSDPLQLNRLNLTASYSPATSLDAEERLHLRADYQRYDWRARATYNDANFYDLFGPTKTGRKGYTAGVGYHRTLVYDEPRRIDLEIDAMFAGNLDRLPHYQNIEVDVDRLFAYEATLKGQQPPLVARPGGRRERACSGRLTLDGDACGRHLVRPRRTARSTSARRCRSSHSSIWLRSAAGWSPGARDDPVRQFLLRRLRQQLGGSRRGEALSASTTPFPVPNSTRSAAATSSKSTLEWNLPPLRFRRVGTPGFYLTWMRPAVFVGGLVTNLDHEAFRRIATNVGGQLDFQFTTLSTLDMTLSVGGATGLRGRVRCQRREFMVSLKVLR